MSQSKYQIGQAIRREVHGDDYVDRVTQQTDAFNRDFQELITEFSWGSVWSRPGLSRCQRSLISLSILATLNRQHEFEVHIRSALRNGCTVEEIRETLIHLSVYAGVPAAVEAFRVARRVLDAEGIGDQVDAVERLEDC